MAALGKVANGIGQPVRRKEDFRLLTGRGRFGDDLVLPRQAQAGFVRSPYAHARIVAVDKTAALAAPGVLAVLTGADYACRRAWPDPAQSRALGATRRPGAAVQRPADRDPPLPAAGRPGALCRGAGGTRRRRDDRCGEGCR